MKIGGYQKISLLDYPEKIVAIVFTTGCNFRCPFCHNPSLIADNISGTQVSEDEIFAFLAKRIGRLDGVCVSGGEPLLQPDLAVFLRRIKELGFLVKLDTNGSSSPDKLQSLLDEHLVDYVAMDIKNSLKKYSKTVGISDINVQNIINNANILIKGDTSYEFRTTLVREFHFFEDIRDIGRWLLGAKKYCLQNFHHMTPLLSKLPLHSFSQEEIMAMKQIADEYFQLVEVRL
ncbi:MAG: anaerobic ribonucleoside-triphosphate reductase activating protein [Planctomycetia bacterium]|nr:anaerobic ribonucleoside-triphosphate reductase activating protein [Planctomycetia bacterium]